MKCIALTFDDGPSPLTPRLLDALEKRHARATFFLVGPNATEYSATVRRERRLGMEIGNHTTHHRALSTLSSGQVRAEIVDTQRRIKKITGSYPTIMRPPYAARSTMTDKVCGKEGLAVITWDASPVDWENHSADKLVQLTVSQASPGQIVLMHDIHPWTVAAVPKIVDKLSAKGYHFVTVSEILGRTRPGHLYPKN